MSLENFFSIFPELYGQFYIEIRQNLLKLVKKFVCQFQGFLASGGPLKGRERSEEFFHYFPRILQSILHRNPSKSIEISEIIFLPISRILAFGAPGGPRTFRGIFSVFFPNSTVNFT